MNLKLGETHQRIGVNKIASIGATVALCLAFVGTLTASSVSGTIISQAAAGPLVWGPSSHSFQLSVSSNATAFRSDDSIKVALSIRNNGPTTSIIRSDFWQEYPFVVRRSDGTLVQRDSVPGIIDSSSGGFVDVLKRGEVYQTHLDLRRLFNLDPGDYTVQASTNIRSYDQRAQNAKPGMITLTSNTIHIHIQI